VTVTSVVFPEGNELKSKPRVLLENVRVNGEPELVAESGTFSLVRYFIFHEAMTSPDKGQGLVYVTVITSWSLAFPVFRFTTAEDFLETFN